MANHFVAQLMPGKGPDPLLEVEALLEAVATDAQPAEPFGNHVCCEL